MAMSKDRVHFLLKDNQSNHNATAEAASDAFGMDAGAALKALREASYKAPLKIICRPSQFARFLIYRSKNVTNNAYSQFEAVLVEDGSPTVLDVSDKPAKGA